MASLSPSRQIALLRSALRALMDADQYEVAWCDHRDPDNADTIIRIESRYKGILNALPGTPARSVTARVALLHGYAKELATEAYAVTLPEQGTGRYVNA